MSRGFKKGPCVKISRIVAREIFDSRGMPTVACEVSLEDGTTVTASVPSGISCGSREAFELRDNEERLMGKGVQKAVHNIEHVIGPSIIGRDPDLVLVDKILKELDPSPTKQSLGANATLAVSIAVCRAQAALNQLELFEMIAALYDSESVSLPFPLFNLINGGMHANNKFPIQEIMLAPVGAQNFRTSFESTVTVFQKLKDILDKKGKSTAVGDEGGFCPYFESIKEPFDLLLQAIQETGTDSLFAIALDVAATQLYDVESKSYRWGKTQKSSDELIEFYQELTREYPLYSIEDGLSEADWEGWRHLFHTLGETLQIVGDDIFVTNTVLIERGIQEGIANASIIKPNQIGTITETLQAIALCHQNNMNAIISHRSGETIDTFISDLAVGTSSGQIKAGGCSRGERIAKYNRLLYIEDLLTMSLLNQ